MRLVYFSRDYTPHDHRFLSFLAGTGIDTWYLRLEKKVGSSEGRPLPPGIKTLDWIGGRKPFRFCQSSDYMADLHRLFREVKPDLVHAGPIPQTAYLAAKCGFDPLVSMSWGSDLLMESRQVKAVEERSRYTLSRTKVLLGDCRAVQERAAELGFPPERSVLFPWGVDLARFKPTEYSELRRKLGWEKCFVLLSLRSWEPIYGVDLILRSFAAASQQVPDLRLLLLGRGSQEKMLKSYIQDHQLDSKIYLSGTVSNDDLPEYYQAADLYLSASYSDGSSVSLMEALACGLPALVSDIPGNREWIQSGEHGWLFTSGDADSLTEGIFNSIRYKPLLGSMKSAARQLALDRADQSRNFARLLDAYHLALSLPKAKQKGAYQS